MFEAFPRLAKRLPWRGLGSLPTPVDRCVGLGEALGIASLYVKRDDRTSAAYGGAKVRKLEPILADALAAGAKRVVTVGSFG